MTCDSDGKIDTYVENEGLDSSLPLHALRAGESYRLAFFLVGAYQEILGDIHNLFGDTDSVEVHIDGDGYAMAQQRRGDTTDVMLDYVGYGSTSCARRIATRSPPRGCRRRNPRA